MSKTHPLECIEGRDVRRTGWTCDARRCPAHGDRLELCFDETDYASWSSEHQGSFNHDDNRVRWRCPACVGSWLENFFLDRPGSPAPRRMLLTCPVCSGRVTHACVPMCCGRHACIDCDAAFELCTELLEVGTQEHTEETLTMPGTLIISTPEPVDPAYRSGWLRTFRRCPEHESPLELVFISLEEEPPSFLAWHCVECSRSWTEPHFRHLRQFFVPDATPGAVCPNCRASAISTTGPNRATCEGCGSILQVRLEPAER
jgi:hypothetical protein